MPRFAANLSFLFTERSFLERFAAAARAGFDAVEFMSPYELPAAEIAGAARAADVEVVLFNTPPGDAKGDFGLAALPGREAELRDGVERALDYATALAAPRVHVLAGLGDPADPAAAATYRSNLAFAADHALRTILDRLLIVVHAAAMRLRETLGDDVVDLPGYRHALIEAATVLNAALTAHTVQHALHEDGTAPDLRASYGTYVISTRRIWAPRAGSSECDGLARPPDNAAGFNDLGDAIIASQRIRDMLAGGDAHRAQRRRPGR